MKFAKGLALFGVVILGLGLFATVFYQSGLLQKIQQDKSALALKKVITPDKNKGKVPAPLTNPNGDTAIAIIQHHRPLEKMILDALDKGDFAAKF